MMRVSIYFYWCYGKIRETYFDHLVSRQFKHFYSKTFKKLAKQGKSYSF